jgi:preprotein translocase subunit Sss1
MQLPEFPTWKEIKTWVALAAMAVLSIGIGIGWIIFG